MPGMSVERIDGYEPKADEHPFADVNFVASDYFRTLRIPIIRGRAFSDSDTEKSQRVAVINQSMAERYWPKQEPIGQRFHILDRDYG